MDISGEAVRQSRSVALARPQQIGWQQICCHPILLTSYAHCIMSELRKAGSNCVDVDRFFDRDFEFDAMAERIRDGTHALIAAQRRVDKISVVRELPRRLDVESEHETLFMELEDARDAADTVAEIAIRPQSIESAWSRIRIAFAKVMERIGDHLEEVEMIQGSPAADLLLPLVTALQQELGQEPPVGLEVHEIAHDIRDRLAEFGKRSNHGQP